MNLLFSLRTRALLLIVFACAVFLATVGYHAVVERQLRLEFASDKLLGTAKLIAAQENHVIEDMRQFLDSLIRAQDRRQSVVPEDCQRTLARKLEDERRVANIAIVLPDGSIVCSAVPASRPVNISDRPHFQLALKTQRQVIGEATLGRITGKLSLPFVSAFRDASGRTLGVFLVALDASWLTREITNSISKYPEGARLGLIDAKGRVIARHPDPEGWVGKDASGTLFFKAVSAHGGEGTFEEIGFDGVARIYGLARFADTASGPLTLWVGFAKDSVTAEVERDFARTVIAVLALLVLTFAVLWVGGERLLLRPISILSAAARRLGQGDLSARTGLGNARDELGVLAQSFDDMAQSLETKNRQVLLAARAVKVLSAWNQALLAPGDEKALIETMCRSIVEEGGYRAVWVGFAKQDEARTVEPVAWWGVDAQFIENLRVTWADAERGRGPAGRAIRGAAAVIVNDYLTNPDTAPWRENALRYRYNSLISLPFKLENAVIGAVTIYAAESEAFGEQEAVLLTEVAAALASGIGAVRARVKQARLEVSLQTSEQRFRAAAEASLDALFVLSSQRDAADNLVDFEFADLNARAERRLGMTRNTVIGKSIFEIVPMFKGTGFFDKYAQVVRSGIPFEDEFPFDLPQQGTRWFRQQVVPVGEGVAVTLREITVWKTAGDRIRQSEERLRLAMDAARMGAWSLDFETNTYSTSEGMGPIFGFARGEGPRSFKELLRAVHPDDREAVADGASKNRATLAPRHLEYRVLWPDGTVHWVEAHSDLKCDASGKAARSVGVLVDITQRKLDAASLERANRALRTLSAGNEALVRAMDESALLHALCRVLVEKGGYRMAAVGYPQHDSGKSIMPMAWAGVEEGYISAVKHTWADTEQGQRPIARTLRSGRAEIARDVRNDPAFDPIRELAAKAGYASNLALPLLDRDKIIGALSIHAVETDAFDAGEVALLRELAEDLSYGIITLRTRAERDRIAHAHQHHEEILRKSLEDSIQAIATTVEMRDPYTSGHQKRVAELAVAIATEMGLDEDRIHGLHLAGVVHDLGKISVPAEILAKPGKLTAIEHMLIQAHAQAGYDILKDIDFPWPIATVVWQHHERLDGSGYPLRLKRDAILLESRILAVADVVEAMASHRPYRPTLGIDVALQEIERGRGRAYDPAVADACLSLFRDKGFILPN